VHPTLSVDAFTVGCASVRECTLTRAGRERRFYARRLRQSPGKSCKRVVDGHSGAVGRRRVLRAAAAGTALGILRAYRSTAGFRDLAPRIQSEQAKQNPEWKTDIELTTEQAIAIVAALGAVSGVGYAALTRATTVRGAVPGAMVGVALWAAWEGVYRLAPKRASRWHTSPQVAVPRFGVLGAMIGLITDEALLSR
jgi:hypothetical protein